MPDIYSGPTFIPGTERVETDPYAREHMFPVWVSREDAEALVGVFDSDDALRDNLHGWVHFSAESARKPQMEQRQIDHGELCPWADPDCRFRGLP